jgi:glycogen debranching enzyme
MNFDLELVPFSIRGAWFGLSRLPAARAKELGKSPALYLRTYRGNVPMHQREIAAVSFVDDAGKPVQTVDDAQPGRLRFAGPRGSFVEFAFASPSTLVLSGRNLGVRLELAPTNYDYARTAGTDCWELNLFSQRLQLLLHRESGAARVEAPWAEAKSTAITVHLGAGRPRGEWQATLTEFFVTPPAPPPAVPCTAAAHAAATACTAFTARFPAVPRHLRSARELAGYVLWSALVKPSGHLRREGMLMSKNWMVNIWSWDHCFNAIALAPAHPQLAWDQWAVMFDHQDSTGALPDTLNDRDLVLNFTKPPVHGWALREMMRRGWKLPQRHATAAIRFLERWTGWWFTHRDDDGDGLPQYNHGNDSGWDNATCFGAGMPVEGPDLATFLVVQMDVLAELHRRHGSPQKAAQWTRRADRLVQRLIAHSWQGDRFVAPRSGDHTIAPGDSLVAFMPLLLGRRLPPDLRAVLIAGLATPGRFLTPHGLATESPRSPLYRPDGYWRGPVWAPSTQLIVAGLEACGETKLALEISRRFCATFARSGSAENFDALTGEGLRDRAYTWTASAFLSLAATLSR